MSYSIDYSGNIFYLKITDSILAEEYDILLNKLTKRKEWNSNALVFLDETENEVSDFKTTDMNIITHPK